AGESDFAARVEGEGYEGVRDRSPGPARGRILEIDRPDAVEILPAGRHHRSSLPCDRIQSADHGMIRIVNEDSPDGDLEHLLEWLTAGPAGFVFDGLPRRLDRQRAAIPGDQDPVLPGFLPGAGQRVEDPEAQTVVRIGDRLGPDVDL